MMPDHQRDSIRLATEVEELRAENESLKQKLAQRDEENDLLRDHIRIWNEANGSERVDSTEALGHLHVIRSTARFIQRWTEDPNLDLEREIARIIENGDKAHVALGGNPPKAAACTENDQ